MLHVSLKLAQWFWRSIFTISQLSSLWKGLGLSFEQTWVPFTWECFVPSLVEIGTVVLEKKLKMWKIYRWMDRRMDRQRTTGDQKSSLELSAQLRWANIIHKVAENENKQTLSCLKMKWLSLTVHCLLLIRRHHDKILCTKEAARGRCTVFQQWRLYFINKHKNRNSYLIDHLFKDNVQLVFRDNYVVKWQHIKLKD